MEDYNIIFPKRPMKVCPTDCDAGGLIVFAGLRAFVIVALAIGWFLFVPGSNFAFGFAISLIVLLVGLFMAWFFKLISGPLRTRVAVVRALSNQVLSQKILRLDSRSYSLWHVRWFTPTGAVKTCSWLTTNTPIFMDRSQNLVLGVTAGDGTMCMPLDTTLLWIDLTDAERTQMRKQIGPERLQSIPLPVDVEF